MLTWQIAREGVGGVCKEDPPEPGAAVDESAPKRQGRPDLKKFGGDVCEKWGISLKLGNEDPFLGSWGFFMG